MLKNSRWKLSARPSVHFDPPESATPSLRYRELLDRFDLLQSDLLLIEGAVRRRVNFHLEDPLPSRDLGELPQMLRDYEELYVRLRRPV